MNTMFRHGFDDVGHIEPMKFNFPAPKPKGGMFGGKPDWAGALSAALAALSAGMGSQVGQISLQMLNQRMGQKREDERYQRQRQDGLADYAEKLKIAQQYKGPDYDAFQTRLIESGVRPGSPEWVDAHKRKSQIDLNPMVMTVYGPMPYSAVVGQQQVKPVGKITPIEDEGGPSPLGSRGPF